MSWTESAGAARALFPSLGYFGSTEADCLVVSIGERISSLRLSVDDGSESILSLQGLRFFRDGAPIDIEPDRIHATQSSRYSGTSESGPELLLEQRGIHTDAEDAPWWECRLRRPAFIGSVRIYNRGDQWGQRSRTLRVDGEIASGGVRVWHASMAPDRVTALFGRLTMLAGGIDGAESPDAMRVSLVRRIAARVERREVDITSFEAETIYPLLPIWSARSLSHDEIVLLAATLVANASRSRRTSLRLVEHALPSRRELERLDEALARVSVTHDLPRPVLARGFTAPSTASNNASSRLALLGSLIELLSREGRDPMLSHGALLGAIRDGSELAHDPDVDVLYRVDAATRSEAEAEIRELANRLWSTGFVVGGAFPHRLELEVRDPGSGAVVDMVPCIGPTGFLAIPMRDGTLRPVDPTCLYPRSTIAFGSTNVPSPADVPRFLECLYGPTFDVPDRFFEWPWRLDEA